MNKYILYNRKGIIQEKITNRKNTTKQTTSEIIKQENETFVFTYEQNMFYFSDISLGEPIEIKTINNMFLVTYDDTSIVFFTNKILDNMVTKWIIESDPKNPKII